jgi:hypothetical protein
MEPDLAIDTIDSLILAAIRYARRLSEGQSGTKAEAMLRQEAGKLFTELVGRVPTAAKLERILTAAGTKAGREQ